SILKVTFLPPPWWAYAIVPALLGLLARGKVRRRAVEEVAELRIAPLELPVDKPVKLKYSLKKDMPFALRTISWIQERWDNPVLIKELRVKLRGHMGRLEIAAFGVLFALVPALCYIYPDILPAPVEWLTLGLFGDRIAPLHNLLGASISIIALFTCLIMPFV